jgi:hypothetical protein
MRKFLCAGSIFISAYLQAQTGKQEVPDSVVYKKALRKMTSADRVNLLEGKGTDHFSHPPAFDLLMVEIISARLPLSGKQQRKYVRLFKAIKKVYPYARKAGDRLQQSDKAMARMSRPERKAYVKQVEKDLEREFGKEIRQLNFTEGRILLKLIDRETGRTAYRLVDDLRGRFAAWFYDGLAGIFGYDLERDFDPEQSAEDRYIEEIVRLLESGKI